MYGRHHTNESKEKMSKAMKNREKKICPHCGKTVDISNYARWHGKKCKRRMRDED